MFLAEGGLLAGQITPGGAIFWGAGGRAGGRAWLPAADRAAGSLLLPVSLAKASVFPGCGAMLGVPGPRSIGGLVIGLAADPAGGVLV